MQGAAGVCPQAACQQRPQRPCDAAPSAVPHTGMRSRRALDAACRWGGAANAGARLAPPPGSVVLTVSGTDCHAPLSTLAGSVTAPGVAARAHHRRDVAGSGHARRVTARCLSADSVPASPAPATESKAVVAPPPRRCVAARSRCVPLGRWSARHCLIGPKTSANLTRTFSPQLLAPSSRPAWGCTR
jgi:hypothetical protein